MRKYALPLFSEYTKLAEHIDANKHLTGVASVASETVTQHVGVIIPAAAVTDKAEYSGNLLSVGKNKFSFLRRQSVAALNFFVKTPALKLKLIVGA